VTALVLDASAGVDLLLDTVTGRRLQRAIPANAKWWVPEHYFAEVAAVLRRAEINQITSQARVAAAFTELVAAPVRRVQVRPLLPEAWGRRGNLTVHDALYVVLASHLSASLVTTDAKLANAPNLGVPTITAAESEA
jgi:predicted nucleic acid-binding protein